MTKQIIPDWCSRCSSRGIRTVYNGTCLLCEQERIKKNRRINLWYNIRDRTVLPIAVLFYFPILLREEIRDYWRDKNG